MGNEKKKQTKEKKNQNLTEAVNELSRKLADKSDSFSLTDVTAAFKEIDKEKASTPE